MVYSYIPQCLPANDKRKRKGTLIEDTIAKKELVTYEKIESLIKVEGYPISLTKFRKFMKQYLDKKKLVFVKPSRINKSINNLKDKKLIGVMAYYLEINKYVKSRLSITTSHYHDYIVLLSKRLKKFNKSLKLDQRKIDRRIKKYIRSCKRLIGSYVPQCLPTNNQRERERTLIEDTIAKKKLVTYEKIESLIKVEGYPISLRKFRKFMKQYLDKKKLVFVSPSKRSKVIKNLKDKKLIGVMAYYLEINKYVESRLSMTTRHYHDYIVLLSKKLKKFNKSLKLDQKKIDRRVKRHTRSCKKD